MTSLLVPLKRYTPDVWVTSFLHDGLSLWVVDKDRTQPIVTQLQRAFSDQAHRYGFATALEQEPQTPSGSLGDA